MSSVLQLLFFSLFIVINSAQLSAQLITPHPNGFQYEDQIYKYRDLGWSVLSTNKLAFARFQKSRSLIHAGITLTSAGLFLGLYSLPFLRGVTRYERTVRAYCISAAIPLLTFAIIKFMLSKKYKKQSIDLFNQSAIGLSEPNYRATYVDIGTTDIGFGLIVNF